ncbi:cytochrome c oxidase subunit 7B, mitochondrial [Chanos chanos]|uniref:Cytochrome c oxidase subunit 7B, mitochondrial n=1 Tax=Chanos chanos TaxID=29144 RepID=A0A6J2WXR1_CHACN|nr:cytochrome c oxidase subunit 7B, mitochondrial-like [Chanos chanos]
MYRFAKAALNLTGQGARQVAVRHGSSDISPDFHAKYGTMLMVAGGAFCAAVWGYVITSTGISWNLSPVGKVQPKEWKE